MFPKRKLEVWEQSLSQSGIAANPTKKVEAKVEAKVAPLTASSVSCICMKMLYVIDFLFTVGFSSHPCRSKRLAQAFRGKA